MGNRQIYVGNDDNYDVDDDDDDDVACCLSYSHFLSHSGDFSFI